MKRSEFKPRTTALASTGFKRKAPKKRTPYKKAKEAAWKAFSKYIRLRDALHTTGSPDTCICVTCEAVKPTFGVGCIHAGHWLGGRLGLNLFEENGCHGQCWGCNCNEHGKSAAYQAFMLDNYTPEEIDRITLQANTTHKFTVDELEALRVKYERKYEEIGQ
jgi:hypothetical protein